MTRQLVLVHGRSQQHKDPAALKAEWLDALAEGMAKSGLRLPVPEEDVRFPYYGDTLYQMVGGASPQAAAQIVVRGEAGDEAERRFLQSVLEEVRLAAGITDQQLAAAAEHDVIDRGLLTWAWVRAMADALDRYVPYASGALLALTTHDVYQYLRNSAIRQEIDEGVSGALTPGRETVVVGHSLGSVVSYNLLRREGHLRGWRVPLFVTLGSPLAVTAIRKSLTGMAPARCPQCVTRWINAMDSRDLVALRALTPEHFPLDPERPGISNRTAVRNHTANRHGIGGYLDDKDVARSIHDALTAQPAGPE
ncbi:hypothetical protein [Streptomyces sp. NPDC055287]